MSSRPTFAPACWRTYPIFSGGKLRNGCVLGPARVKVGSGTREARYLHAYDRPILVAAAELLERARTEFDEEQYRMMADTRQRVRDGAAGHGGDDVDAKGRGVATHCPA